MLEMKRGIKRWQVSVNLELHRQVKTDAASKMMTINNYIINALTRQLESEREGIKSSEIVVE
ncbi:MAG: hypothetical protein HQK94_18035 [Nitrospirae bacterium]|nr:hypothetical protein [Nitrospirota bacterium]